MRKKAGAFKTTPTAAREAELDLPPADLRLDKTQRAYATRLFTLPENHPLLPLCPDTFPKTLDNEREEIPGNYTHWHEKEPNKPKYSSRLTRILSKINTTIQPSSIIEEIDVTADSPWDDSNTLDIHIPIGPKDVGAQNHKKKHFFTHVNVEHLCFYTDGSLLHQQKKNIHLFIASGCIRYIQN